MFRILIAICLVLASCQKSEIPAALQVVRININTEPASLDPRTARDSDGSNVLHMLFEGLTRTSLSGEVELALADDASVSEDGLKYTFLLKKTKWSNGDPLTSFDFASSWKTMLDPKYATDAAYHLYPIKNARKAKTGEAGLNEVGIQTPDPYTLIIELERPTPYFLELLTMHPFFPVHEKSASKNPNWAHEAASYISNGPFRMERWIHSDEIALKKNPHYWESESVRLDEIDIVVANADTGLRMFEEKKIDWTGSPLASIPIDAVKDLKEENKLQHSPFLATYFLRVNTEERIGGKPNPLSNALFRRALAYALDRSSITEHLLQGGQKAATSLVPPEMELNIFGCFSDRETELAKALLKRAREEMGEFAEPLTISYYNNERNAAIAQALQKQWQEHLNIAVEIQAVEPKIYFQIVSKGEYQLATGSWTADFNDPINFLEVFKYKESGTNNTGWENTQYIDLLNRSALCKDSEERKQILRQAESLLMEEMPIIPIYHFALNYLKSEDLAGVQLSPLGQIDFRRARWERENSSLSPR
jgi:oligopeptide transport system substrate-binding protein